MDKVFVKALLPEKERSWIDKKTKEEVTRTIYPFIDGDGLEYECWSEKIRIYVGKEVGGNIIKKTYKGEEQRTFKFPKSDFQKKGGYNQKDPQYFVTGSAAQIVQALIRATDKGVTSDGAIGLWEKLSIAGVNINKKVASMFGNGKEVKDKYALKLTPQEHSFIMEHRKGEAAKAEEGDTIINGKVVKKGFKEAVDPPIVEDY